LSPGSGGYAWASVSCNTVSSSSWRLSRRNTKNFRALRVRATIFCSSGVNAIGGFHMMGSSRAQGFLHIIRPHSCRSCRPSTIRFLSN
jgi:hypothetical protein